MWLVALMSWAVTSAAVEVAVAVGTGARPTWWCLAGGALAMAGIVYVAWYLADLRGRVLAMACRAAWGGAGLAAAGPVVALHAVAAAAAHGGTVLYAHTRSAHVAERARRVATTLAARALRYVAAGLLAAAIGHGMVGAAAVGVHGAGAVAVGEVAPRAPRSPANSAQGPPRRTTAAPNPATVVALADARAARAQRRSRRAKPAQAGAAKSEEVQADVQSDAGAAPKAPAPALIVPSRKEYIVTHLSIDAGVLSGDTLAPPGVGGRVDMRLYVAPPDGKWLSSEARAAFLRDAERLLAKAGPASMDLLDLVAARYLADKQADRIPLDAGDLLRLRRVKPHKHGGWQDDSQSMVVDGMAALALLRARATVEPFPGAAKGKVKTYTADGPLVIVTRLQADEGKAVPRTAWWVTPGPLLKVFAEVQQVMRLPEAVLALDHRRHAPAKTLARYLAYRARCSGSGTIGMTFADAMEAAGLGRDAKANRGRAEKRLVAEAETLVQAGVLAHVQAVGRQTITFRLPPTGSR